MAKKQIVKKRSRLRVTFTAIVALVAVAVVISLIQSSRQLQPLSPVHPVGIPEDHVNIKILQMQGTVQGILEASKDDPIPSIRQLSREMFHRLDTGQLSLAIATAYDGRTVAGIAIKAKETPTLIFAGPELERLQQSLRADEFRDKLLCIALHEAIHSVYTPARGKQTKQRYIDGETRAWALTVTMLVRPLQKAGRYVSDDDSEANQAYKDCGDSPTSSKWRQWVEAHRCL